MAKGFDVLHVKSAVKSHNKFNLSRTHLTTMNFGQIVPLFAEETVPGDKFDVSANYFSRMAPLVKPTYGKFSLHTMTSFVPYHQIADDIEAWFAGKTSWEGQTPDSRYITLEQLVQYLNTTEISTSVASTAAYDFTYVNTAGAQQWKKFTEKGKWVYRILTALGYAYPGDVDQRTTGGNGWNSVSTQKLSALPLLAFAKAFNDWMSQSQRFNTSTLSSFLKLVKHNVSTTGYIPASHTINYLGLQTIFDAIAVCYENDYFTSAWQNPNNPIASNQSLGSLQVPGIEVNTGSSVYPANIAVNGVEGTRLQITGLTEINEIHQRSLDFLKSFDDWVRRNNFSGSRAVQQVYSRFGIKTSDYRSNYCEVIDTDIIPVQVGDVTALGAQFISTASTKNTDLGDYAGKGIVNGQNGFSYKANDYGMLFVFGWYTVTPMNSYGFDKMVLKNSPLDYYNPEFDGLGAQAISVGEYFSDPRSVSSSSTRDQNVYGFTERYNEYRFGRDKITGEFRTFPTLSGSTNEMSVWHTGRDLSAVRNAGNLVAQNKAVVTLDPASSEYNRMFSVTDNSIDHFYLTAQFNVSAVRPMLSLNQVPRLGEGDTNVPRNGNEVN